MADTIFILHLNYGQCREKVLLPPEFLLKHLRAIVVAFSAEATNLNYVHYHQFKKYVVNVVYCLIEI